MNTQRNPEQTRQELLEAGFWEIHRSGFRSASLENILAQTGVTKGALYHHFPNKTALGYAVVEELLGPWIRREWTLSAEQGDDVIALMKDRILEHYDGPDGEFVKCGCPLNNLIQEMSGLDEGFRLRLDQIIRDWVATVSSLLERGIESGQLRADLDASSAAHFIVASLEGIAGAVKSAGDKERGRPALQGLLNYLDSLRSSSLDGAST